MEKQKFLGANSTARRRPLSSLSGNKPSPALQSLICKAHPHADPAAQATTAEIDELISEALKCQNVSKKATREIESFNGFLTDTKASFKQWSSRLKQALETGLVKTEAIPKNTPGTCLNTAAKGNDKLISCSTKLPDTGSSKNTPGTCLNNAAKGNDKLIRGSSKLPDTYSSQNTPGTCLHTAVKGSGKLISGSSKLPDTDPLESPCSNFTEVDMIVSPSPLVSWNTGSCIVESGKQLFLLTPLPKTKACSSRCQTSKTQMKTVSSTDQLNNLLRPVSKLTISDNNHPDLEQSVKVKESWTSTTTPHVALANKASLEDKLCSPRTFSVQKSRTLPRSCLKTALSSKQQLFSPIPEGRKEEDIDSNGSIGDDKCSSDKISKDLASRYDIYGLNQSNRQVEDPLQWFLSPLKTMVLIDPSEDNQLPTPARSNMGERLDIADDKPIHTPAVHSKALLGTPWKGLESTNLKGRCAGETTLKKELWTRFEAASTNELHFDKVRFQQTDAKCFLDMLEEEAS
ncbi:hypothetical protein ZEAMMB73_Zm00001d010818 [Zea mays]|uniref:Uncharacterized protein n=1 Tax=Zea mays TaxID=4577 RepID=K7UXK6_MAIZE|nr:hypothetical protein ZEAMMB73_Zm00001d010818 [Zea mays]